MTKINGQFYSKYQSVEDGNENAMDNFTNRLMQQQFSKWEITKRKHVKNILNDLPDYHREKVENLSINEIDWLLQETIDIDDSAKLIQLTKECIKYDKCPSLSVLLHILSVCSQKGDKDTIVAMVQLCENHNPNVLQENSNFEHYLAEAIWVKGNIVKSLEIFEKIYRENVFLRREVKCMLKNLIENVLSDKSEAGVINVIRFSERLVREYNEYYPLGCIWQICFLSPWFTDQQMSLDLLEKYPNLCKFIINRIPYVVNMSLFNHQLEPIYKLTELLLKHNMKMHLPSVIVALIDYFIKFNDLRRCKEIIKWTVKNDIDLPTVLLNDKLMNIFLNEATIKKEIKKQSIKKYKF
ncbi:hypothetical protein GWI33_021205 [Rhynchophorus ferrugineus]|uniref:Uncharacterized protein n=1 Tax=Rhynchophorus ferrugineus TaxID=354439 RepID=A0A834HQX2_RHYFE|nr:hypothetical protein GWI33_021205 [Rhynchophorus ferrugineus]